MFYPVFFKPFKRSWESECDGKISLKHNASRCASVWRYKRKAEKYRFYGQLGTPALFEKIKIQFINYLNILKYGYIFYAQVVHAWKILSFMRSWQVGFSCTQDIYIFNSTYGSDQISLQLYGLTTLLFPHSETLIWRRSWTPSRLLHRHRTQRQYPSLLWHHLARQADLRCRWGILYRPGHFSRSDSSVWDIESTFHTDLEGGTIFHQQIYQNKCITGVWLTKLKTTFCK